MGGGGAVTPTPFRPSPPRSPRERPALNPRVLRCRCAPWAHQVGATPPKNGTPTPKTGTTPKPGPFIQMGTPPKMGLSSKWDAPPKMRHPPHPKWDPPHPKNETFFQMDPPHNPDGPPHPQNRTPPFPSWGLSSK